MPSRKSKTADTERLDDKSLEKAIQYLEDKGTKKGACEILGITYNTTRLDKLIAAYRDRKLAEAQRKSEKRGKPATEAEIAYIVSSYLEGASMDSIASALYRGISFVRGILDKKNVPLRNQKYDYFNPPLLPEEAIREEFREGELVYSARYDSLAKIISRFNPKKLDSDPAVYCIWLGAEKWQQFAYQPAYELASLEHLKDYIQNVR